MHATTLELAQACRRLSNEVQTKQNWNDAVHAKEKYERMVKAATDREERARADMEAAEMATQPSPTDDPPAGPSAAPGSGHDSLPVAETEAASAVGKAPSLALSPVTVAFEPPSADAAASSDDDDTAASIQATSALAASAKRLRRSPPAAESPDGVSR